jgi:hypothetical protein
MAAHHAGSFLDCESVTLVLVLLIQSMDVCHFNACTLHLSCPWECIAGAMQTLSICQRLHSHDPLSAKRL